VTTPLLSAFGSGRFTDRLGHQLLAAAEPVGDVRLSVAPASQQSHEICAIRHGGRLGQLGQLAAHAIKRRRIQRRLWPDKADTALTR
jgi:hypothetical protein